MNHPNPPYRADIAMVITCFLWGLNAVVTKNALGNTPDSFQTFIFNGLRIPAASLLLFLAVKLTGKRVALKREDIPLVAGVSLFGMFLFMMMFILGMSLTSASNSGVINASTPLFILLITFFTRKEKPSSHTILGIIIGFSGMILLTFQYGTVSFNPGDLFLLLSCFFWGIYTVYGRKILTVYDPMVSTAWIYFFTSLYQLPFFFRQFPAQCWREISIENWINLAISCIGSLFLANTLYYYSIKNIGPSRVGVYTNLTPGFTLILAWLIGGETISLFQIAGLLVIITGIFISNSHRGRNQPVRTSREVQNV
jgi:drug/metabolite transporter (DMT)-like permease